MTSPRPWTSAGRLAFGAAALLTLGSLAAGQTNPLSKRTERVSIDSGLVSNEGFVAETISAFYVSQPGAPWMRLSFDEVTLAGSVPEGTGSILKITSLEDGYYQYLNAATVQQWQDSSAYFNGDLLLVEIIAQPGTGLNRVVVDEVTIGTEPPSNGEDSICGVDDRQFSNDARAARILPVGCTGFLIDDACGCMLTAGHCSFGTQTIQFNVPISNSNGSLNHPPPSDQYTVDSSSMQSNGGQGIGNDWAYFGVFPNSTTGLKPAEAQGATYILTDPPSWNSSLQVRITGYGTDSGTSNQAQQTHVGPWLSYTGGNRLQYQTDTTGGNSGSPVIQEQAGVVMGIHTHAGCSATSGNNGTASVHPGLVDALANPQGVCEVTAPVTCQTVPVATVFNGTGVNPVCLGSVTPPALGTDWTVSLDTSAIPGGSFAGFQIRNPGPSAVIGIGEVMLDLTSPAIYHAGGAGPNFDVPIPNNVNLAGFQGRLQGYVQNPGVQTQLCNSLDFTLGCVQ